MAAVDTAVTVKSNGGGEVGLPNNIQILSRRIDFSAANLTNGDWFRLFTLPAGACVLQGLVQIHTTDSGGGTLALGKEGGNEIMTALALSSGITQKVTNTAVQLSTSASDTVDVVAGTADVTTADVTFILVVLIPGGTPPASLT